MKKIVSLILCLVMLLSLGSVAIAANEATPAPAEEAKLMFATHAPMGLTVDGKMEVFMTMSTLADNGLATFGAAWDKDTLYIGMSGAVMGLRSAWGTGAMSGLNGTLTPLFGASVTIGEETYSVSDAGNAEVEVKEAEELETASAGKVNGNFFVEFGIPFEDLEVVELEDGTVVVEDVTLTYAAADADCKFVGTIVITDERVVAKQDIAGRSDSGQTYRLGADYRTGEAGNRTRFVSSQNLASVPTVGLKAGNMPLKNYPVSIEGYSDDNSTISSIYYPQKNNAYTSYLYTTGSEAGVATSVQEDLYITGLPIADLTAIEAEVSTEGSNHYTSLTLESNATNPARVLLVAGWGTGTKASTSVGFVIYNTADGLVLYDDVATNYIALGVTLNEWFTIRFEIDGQKDAEVYVNGEYLGTMPASSNTCAFVNGHGFDNGFATSITAGNSVVPNAAGTSYETSTIHIRNPLVTNQKPEATSALKKLIGQEEIVTQAPATDAPNNNDNKPTTSAPSNETAAPGTDANDGKEEKKGCGSSIAGGAIALICTVSLAGVALKKKRH